MTKPLGAELAVEDFDEMFQPTIASILDSGPNIYESLRPFVRQTWSLRSLRIVIVNNPAFDAEAHFDAENDVIRINRGTMEVLFGNCIGLLSLPSFLPELGESDSESPPALIPRGFLPIPMLPKCYRDAYPVYYPLNELRLSFGMQLAHHACQFVIYHELGHFAGHHHSAPLQGLVERQIFECDADAFAMYVMSLAHGHEEICESLREVIEDTQWEAKYCTILMTILATTTLLRIIPHDGAVGALDSSHPHPAVRTYVAAVIAAARGSNCGLIPKEGAEEIIAKAVNSVEDVWRRYAFPATYSIVDPLRWMPRVKAAGWELFFAWHRARPKLEKFARAERRWDDYDDGGDA